MKKFLAIYLIGQLLLVGNLIAQRTPCYFDEYVNDDRLWAAERQIQNGVAEIIAGKRNLDTVKFIPIVVHLIHNGGPENISEAQIQSQIQVLNEDYGKMPGSSGEGAGVDTEVRFFLARLDPKGNCTKGIVRIKSPLTNHQTYQRALLKELSFWDNTRYLNIYVVKKINGNVGGYSSFPGGPPDEDGVVVRHHNFGRIGTANGVLGRTTTHELGHWFGLHHTFNNACGGDICSDGDFVCDTPPALEPNFNCTTKNTCQNDVPDRNDLKENYMDYTPDACKDMFTEGQKMRMQATLNQLRVEIWSNDNLVLTGYDSIFIPPTTCPVVADFVTLTPEICFGNSIRFMDRSLNDATNWQWSFPGGNPNFSSEANPVVRYDAVGVYDVKLIVFDGLTADSLTLGSYINVGTPGRGGALPYQEDFDAGLHPPEGITINNPDGEISWELDSIASRSGKYSMRINNLINTNYGTVDEIILDNLDFTALSSTANLYMSFNWAYAKSDPSFSDELLVLLSTDCGTNFKQIFYKAGNALTTGPTQTTSFIPDSTQWKNAFIDLDEFKEETFVQVKIVNVTDGGNNLYLDDLYIGNGDDLVATTDVFTIGESLKIYPNPTSSQINLHLELSESDMLSVSLYNAQGRLVKEIPKQIYPAGEQQLSIPTTGLPTAIYFVMLESANHQKAVKVLVEDY